MRAVFQLWSLLIAAAGIFTPMLLAPPHAKIDELVLAGVVIAFYAAIPAFLVALALVLIVWAWSPR